MLCGYMDRQGYVIGRKDGQLYRGEPQAETKGIAWEETTIDDLVDSACEWNYELLREAEAKMENPDYLTDFAGEYSCYEGLRSDETVLDGMFDRTKYGKELDVLAVKLVEELVADMGRDGGIDAAIKKMADQIKAGEDLLPDVSPALKKNGGKIR